MQEQKKYQIERVDHASICTLHTCCIIDYYPMLDLLGQINYTDDFFAIENKTNRTIGMWRIKQQKLNH